MTIELEYNVTKFPSMHCCRNCEVISRDDSGWMNGSVILGRTFTAYDRTSGLRPTPARVRWAGGARPSCWGAILATLPIGRQVELSLNMGELLLQLLILFTQVVTIETHAGMGRDIEAGIVTYTTPHTLKMLKVQFQCQSTCLKYCSPRHERDPETVREQENKRQAEYYARNREEILARRRERRRAVAYERGQHVKLQERTRRMSDYRQ